MRFCQGRLFLILLRGCTFLGQSIFRGWRVRMCDRTIAALFGLVANVPAVIEILSQLIALISSGAGVPEIAAAIGSLAGPLGVSIEERSLL